MSITKVPIRNKANMRSTSGCINKNHKVTKWSTSWVDRSTNVSLNTFYKLRSVRIDFKGRRSSNKLSLSTSKTVVISMTGYMTNSQGMTIRLVKYTPKHRGAWMTKSFMP